MPIDGRATNQFCISSLSMPRKTSSPNLLFQYCQHIFDQTKDKKLSEAESLPIATEVDQLCRFFGINPIELYVLCYYVKTSLNEEGCKLDELVAHFGNDLSQLPIIHTAIHSLITKGRLQDKPVNKSGGLNAFKPAIIQSRTIKALLTGSKKDLQIKKLTSFVDLIETIVDQVNLKYQDTISGDAMQTEVAALIKLHGHFKEVEWMLSFKLNLNEQIVFIMVIAEALDGIDVTHMSDIISKVCKSNREAYQFKNQMVSGKNGLICHGLLSLEKNDFMQCEFVHLSKESHDIIFHEGNLMKKKRFHVRTASLIDCDKILAEPLFYPAQTALQIATLENALADKNYTRICRQMSGLNTNKGFTLLFHGEPGTGKTATVKQLARKTGRHILMVDTSKIKDMYVGESEKNIRRVFKEYAQAKESFDRHPILLFNEADALIGKRIFVNSSVDQMNNTMQNILLQQLEDFEGIFIATTNLPNSLDDAFNRRLLYKVAYNKPDKAIRLQLLQQHFKYMTIPFLEMINERYPLTGAQIMNINKKLLVERFLHEEVDLPQLIEQFCREELQLLKSTKEATIGFLKRVS